MKSEWYARLILIILAAVAILAVGLGWRSYNTVPVVHARMPKNGGWSPASLEATVGEPLHLRLTSDDVIHGFAIGASDWPVVEVQPGETKDVTLTFERPGKYTFYCTRWCGPNHWRMRGVIQVKPQPGELAPNTKDEPGTPLYTELNLDLDAPHPAQTLPQVIPSAAQGLSLDIRLPEKYLLPRFYQTHSPVQAWDVLRREPLTEALTDQQVWGLVAVIWASNTSPQELEIGENLYTQNCVACHGGDGSGQGVFADDLVEKGATVQPGFSQDGHGIQAPVEFNDPSSMLGASPALLKGKILRGGMGTGMPYWGPIFTHDQIWALVDYLYTFQFDYETEVKP